MKELDKDDLKTVSHLLAPHYFQTPEERKRDIESIAAQFPDSKSVETGGFLIWTTDELETRHVNVANHFFKALGAKIVIPKRFRSVLTKRRWF